MTTSFGSGCFIFVLLGFLNLSTGKEHMYFSVIKKVFYTKIQTMSLVAAMKFFCL